MMIQGREGNVVDASPADGHQISDGTEESCQLVTCCVGQEEFAVDILSVQEINRMVDITRVPKAPVFVEGVINLTGTDHSRVELALPVRDSSEGERTARSRIVVVNVRTRVVGLIVDSVSEVLRLPKRSDRASAVAGDGDRGGIHSGGGPN